MKMRSATNFSLPVVLALAVAFLAGCATTPSVNWNSRIGNYTYDQAVAELGPPDRQIRLSNGNMVFKWIARPYGGGRFGTGPEFLGNHPGFAPSQSIGSGYSNHVLQLTFDLDDTLIAWSKNY